VLVREGGQRGELLRADPEDLVLRTARVNLRGGTVVRFHLHLEVRQLAHNGGQLADGKGERAFLLDFRLDGTADAEVEVGGLEAEHPVRRLEEDIPQDGHGRLGADHVEDLAEALAEVITVGAEFHRARRFQSRVL